MSSPGRRTETLDVYKSLRERDVGETTPHPTISLPVNLSMAYLKVSGTKIVDKDGKEVILRGAGLGGWMKYVYFSSSVAS